MAVAPTIAKQISKNLDGAGEGVASTFSGELILSGDVGAGSSRARNSASAPATRFSATAIPSVRRKPSAGRKRKPAANVPAPAPAVLTQERRDRRRPSSAPFRVSPRTSTGSVPPIRNVGRNKTSADPTNRSINRAL